MFNGHQLAHKIIKQGRSNNQIGIAAAQSANMVQIASPSHHRYL